MTEILRQPPAPEWPGPHVWHRATFTGVVTCGRCGLLPLDDSDFEIPCDVDWQREIRAAWHIPAEIPIPTEEDIADWQPGVWVDSGRMTADDAAREVIQIAHAYGFDLNPYPARLTEGAGWCDDPDDGEYLIEIADRATDYLNDLLHGSGGFDPENWRGYCDLDEWPGGLVAWFGWSGDAGGFGLWVDPEEGDPVGVTETEAMPATETTETMTTETTETMPITRPEEG